MTRWLVTGAGGQLGAELMSVLAASDDEVVGLDRAGLELTDAPAVRTAIGWYAPDVVVNAAAFTAVDAAESRPGSAYLGNVVAPAILASACAKESALLVHVSTDYVFAGDCDIPYAEDAATDPRTVYGRTKLQGEYEVLRRAPDAWVVRTSWLYGEHGSNFVRTMVALERTRHTVSVVDDQYGSPTWARDLAAGLTALGRSSAPPGVYHCTNQGQTSWFGLARAVFEELGAEPARILPIASSEYPTPAVRPRFSVLGHGRWDAAGLPPFQGWRSALHASMTETGGFGASREAGT